MIAYVAELTARPDAADRLGRLLEALVRSTASEPGARIYTVHQQVDDVTRFVVYEAYADQAAGDAHMQSSALQSALQAFGELLAQPPVLRHLNVLDGFARALSACAGGGLL